jgi:FlaA1/EpsC-like NDP-sugar epimerase
MGTTFEVFEAAASLGIDKVIFISTTSVYRPDSRYGGSKILAELIAEDYPRTFRSKKSQAFFSPRSSWIPCHAAMWTMQS